MAFVASLGTISPVLLRVSALVLFIAAACALTPLLVELYFVELGGGCPPVPITFTEPTLLPPACYFSETYWESRARFRQAAASANAKLYKLEVLGPDVAEVFDFGRVVVDKNGGYFIDIAVLPGRPGGGLVVHSSGTHGVEGFAGAGIQTAALHQVRNASEKSSATLMFVHALNPFGMAHYRRFNENNVDLNRNALTPDEFEEVKVRDPNIGGYVDFANDVNLKWIPGNKLTYISIWCQLGLMFMKRGAHIYKRAMASATYKLPRGLFYGGEELQQSHILLEGFLREHNFLAEERVTWIDVHTGVGSAGQDVLIANTHAEATAAATHFPGAPLQATEMGNEADAEAEGYDVTRGMVQQFYQRLFNSANSSVPALVLTQQIGTVSQLVAARALILENAAYQHAPTMLHTSFRWLTRDAFYVRTTDWKARVVDRGTAVFWQAVQRSSAKPP